MRKYNHKTIEGKWPREWEKKKLYKTADKVRGPGRASKKNFYLLVEFPYPSGNLHVGHWYAFSVPDILARMLRMQGKNVLFPIGFDAFGLPAENAAIKNKLNPHTWTYDNIDYMRKQMRSMGTSFDWSREVVTCDPAYYKWTQWQFLQFFKKGLAYQKETAVNWCPKDKTVLANEQVVDGRCERCGTEVVQKEMLQWNLKITDYADRLHDDLAPLDWPEPIKDAQRAWIGRSEGAEIDFPLVLDGKKKYTYVFLHGFTGSPDVARFRYWKSELEKQGHKVIMPVLPNTDKPSEEEQVSTALEAATYDENTVLFGHSLGAVVAMKVLERLKKPIARLVLAGGFADPQFKDKHRNFEKRFEWKFNAEKICRNVKNIQILQDKNDYAVSDEQLRRLEDLLGVKAQQIEGGEPHFTGEKELPILRWLRPTINVFTTRPDTLYGATYLVLAPDHPWVTLAIDGKHDILKNKEEVRAYVEKTRRKTELERAESKEKTGVELKGVAAVNPATGKEMPIWIADFVVGSYGTGAVFADAHDERDYEFAKKHSIPLKETLEPLVVNRVGPDALRAEMPFHTRDGVMAIVKHWNDDKYLCLEWQKRLLNGFVCGGIEKDENAVQAGLREIREETGYQNPKVVRSLGTTIHSRYYHVEKSENRHGRFTPILYELENGVHVEPVEREKALHKAIWLTAKEVNNFLNRDDFRIGWSRVKGDVCYAGKGILFDSDEFNGLTSDEAIPKIGAKFGRMVKQYHLRDWIVSRQRYWGVPIPIIHCPTCGIVAVPDKDLPVKLPEIKDYLPDGSGKSPLAKAKKWVRVKCPNCKGRAERETDTLDTFVDSSWYFLRYTDPTNNKKFADAKKQANWMPVDLYSGGAEHTTMHVLYSRFWHKALFDMGLVKDKEPYTRRMNRSLILGPDGQKMSKSRGNVVDPDEVVARLGADTVRMYLAFIGPYNEVSSYPWNPDGVVGIRRFLERVWRVGQQTVNREQKTVFTLEPLLHKTIKKVGEDIAAQKFNTAISTLMIFLNAVEKEQSIGKEQWEIFLRLLASFAPHIAEELWHQIGNKKSIHLEKWPNFDPKLLQKDTVMIAVQVNGKTRGEAEVSTDADKETMEQTARGAVASRLAEKEVVRVIVVPRRLVNFVIKE